MTTLPRPAFKYRITRARVLAALAAVALVATAVIVLSIPGPSVPLLTVSTAPDPRVGCYTSSAAGPLTVDPVNGTAISETVGHPIPVKWPYGYTARRSGSEVEVVGRNGQVVARTGTKVSMMGGYDSTGFYACGWIRTY